MTEVLFYHLERASVGEVLPGLLEKTLARGWSATVRCADEEQLRVLDEHLWTYRDESFLPHGAGAVNPRNPVWLTTADEVPAGRNVLFTLTAEGFAPSGLSRLTRAILMFTHEDAPPAREAWKKVKAAGLEATYWKQDMDGRWMKAG